MPTLVANIGTSDISVKIGDFYLPIGFDRSEPNLSLDALSLSEREIWSKQKRDESIQKFATEELKLGEAMPSFRQLTQALAKAYQEAPEVWHPRIRIGRIWGVIQSALQSKFAVQRVYLFVTDQAKPHPLDTVYAFDVIQQWIGQEYPELVSGEPAKLMLEKKEIPSTLDAIDEDALLDHYYHFFQAFGSDEVLFVSVKGGTPQMQTALKIQAIAFDCKPQIFLKPQLKAIDILYGQPSICDRVAYWRYQQTQKYQMAERLLQRWDFDGAATLLRRWRDTLQSLMDSQVTDDEHELERNRDRLVQVVAGLDIAVACLNLDQQSAMKVIRKTIKKPDKATFQALLEAYDLLQNLYAQCKIYQELRQVTHFLSRMGSFYEATQNRLIEHLGGQYFDQNELERLPLLTATISRQAPALWRKFIEVHRGFLQKQGWSDRKFEQGYRWNFEKFSKLYLNNRFLKQSFLKALIDYQYGSQYHDRPDLTLWTKLDFWYDRRNEITHAAKGVNEDTVKAIDRDRVTQDKDSCTYADILGIMAQILQQVSPLKVPQPIPPEYYYLYSLMRNWVKDQLLSCNEKAAH